MKFVFKLFRAGRRCALFAVALIVASTVATATGAEKARRARTVDDVRRAACRVGVQNARGSGSIIGLDARLNKYLVLTNYHVVTSEKRATCEFWNEQGRRSKTTGEIVWRAHDQQKPFDFALIAIDRDFVEGLRLPYVPIAGEDVRLEEGNELDSAGCPRGQFVVSWDGGVDRIDRTIEFIPGPYPGQSGSAIIAFIDGKPWNVGILTWLVGVEGSDESKGAFIPVANLWNALTTRRRTADEKPWRAPPNYSECPVPGNFGFSL